LAGNARRRGPDRAEPAANRGSGWCRARDSEPISPWRHVFHYRRAREAAARQLATLASKRHLLQHRSCSSIAQGTIKGATLFDARDFYLLLAQDLAN
jgi:hypothetical protein